MLCPTILKAVGRTPLVRFSRMAAGLACTLYGKCEFMNPGGSLKDRIAVAMIEAAEKSGLIRPGDTLIEATSGNTGIGLAMAGAVRGYQVIVTMPEKMSPEKQSILEALGATVYRTPTEAAWDSPESHISLAKKLQREIPRSHILDQYSNLANPAVHYATTAKEILEDIGEGLAMVVIPAGTGGTISGVSRRLKERLPDIQVIGVDPVGSILGGGDTVCSYLVEGIGYDFMPGVLDNSLVDEYVKIRDRDCFLTARRIIREEGLLVGGSSGGAVWAALQKAASLKADQKCVVILPDGIRNYLNGFVNDAWMQRHGFLS